jgi:predicted hotdog family 3-hydroxylacyl-ACP dehydratase
MISKEQLRTLIPHAGDMCLLDTVEDWSVDHIRCTTRMHEAVPHPLRFQNRLTALHLVEYAAQAMAAHGALLAKNRNASMSRTQHGALAAVRNVRLHISRLDKLDGPLTVEAQRRLSRDDGSIYDFQVRHAELPLADGRIIVAFG